MGTHRHRKLDIKIRGTRAVLPRTRIRAIGDPAHPLFCPRATEPPSTEFLESLRAGQRQPISVWVTGENAYQPLADADAWGPAQFWIADGRRRYAALSLLAEAQQIPDEIWIDEVRGDLADAFRVMAEGNSQRKSETILQRADKVARGHKAFPDKQLAEFARWYDVSVQTIRYWLDLARAVQDVREALTGDKIAMVAARELARLEPEAQARCLEQLGAAIEAGSAKNSHAQVAFVRSWDPSGKAKGATTAIARVVRWRPTRKALGVLAERAKSFKKPLPKVDPADLLGALAEDHEAIGRLPQVIRTRLLEGVLRES